MSLCVCNGHQYLDLDVVVLPETCEANCKLFVDFVFYFLDSPHYRTGIKL